VNWESSPERHGLRDGPRRAHRPPQPALGDSNLCPIERAPAQRAGVV